MGYAELSLTSHMLVRGCCAHVRVAEATTALVGVELGRGKCTAASGLRKCRHHGRGLGEMSRQTGRAGGHVQNGGALAMGDIRAISARV